MNVETEVQAATTDNGQGQEVVRSKRTSPTQTLPSDRLAFDKQLAALRAFAVAFESNGGRPVKNSEAGAILDMSENTIVVTNAFYCDVKLLTRQKDEQAFVPSTEALAYNKAHEWDPMAAGEKFKPVFEKCWFAEAVLPRLKFRAYEDREVLTVLAEASGASKDYEPRLKLLLEFMVFAGLVARDGTQIKPVGSKPAEKMPVAAPTPTAAPEGRRPAAPDENHAEFVFVLDAKRRRNVVVHAPHDMTQKEFDRVRKWMEIQLVAEDTDEQK
jgi:hypothetical protein